MDIAGICANCGVVISIRPYRLKPLNFCSRGCGTRYYAAHPTLAIQQRGEKSRKGKEVPCTRCGKAVYLTANRLIRPTQHNFCSKSCVSSYYSSLRTGEKGSNWRGGISIYPRAFQAARLAALERDSYTCQSLPPHSGRLEVHHKDDDKHNTDLDNLLTLCAKCHKRIHRWCTMEPPVPVVKLKVTITVVSRAVEKNCEHCRGAFTSYPSQKRKFCSYPCKVANQTGREMPRHQKGDAAAGVAYLI